ncbi:ABC-F family ATP-binding cassette domain-containing protein [Actinoplanes sp. TFC3]|uniref:ABC-F family ATP-binding cassette domain-containing protein n=1 Tax=Actinoplanes sp. TFC3 TaxID=1710355 RepID=UPI000829C650|nr:ABC-F family ATP-binding cassette domain-containing protein [Actinoplanes sp. TFC3]
MSGFLTARGLSVLYGPVPVLDAIDLAVGPGDRVLVVGPNGAGKSTLLKVLAGEVEPDAGEVTRPSIGYVPQETEVQEGQTLAGHLAQRTGVAEAATAMEAAAEALAAGDPAAGDDYGRTLDAWLAAGGADFEERCEKVCAQLGLPDDVLSRGGEALSGGQQARLRLAVVLLMRVDLLLLDETTNDLDAPGLAAMEQYVTGFRGGIVAVSHDRAFAERVATRVFEIDEFTRSGRLYTGGWAAYQAERANDRHRAEQNYAEYAARQQAMQERIRRMREWAEAGQRRNAAGGEQDKFIRHKNKTSAQGVAAKAGATKKAADRLEVVEEPREPWELRLSIAAAEAGSRVVFTLRDAIIERGDLRLGPLSLTVAAGDRVRISGPNGSGKSTLIQALLGRLPLAGGERSIGPGVLLGELEQSRAALRGPEPLLEVFRRLSAQPAEEARTLLAKFRVGADVVLRPADSLSPGERTRTGLALFQARKSNCLILDEPTNHLDLEAIEQLEQALATYPGTVLLVTHDRRLAQAVTFTHEIDVTAL